MPQCQQFFRFWCWSGSRSRSRNFFNGICATAGEGSCKNFAGSAALVKLCALQVYLDYRLKYKVFEQRLLFIIGIFTAVFSHIPCLLVTKCRQFCLPLMPNKLIVSCVVATLLSSDAVSSFLPK